MVKPRGNKAGGERITLTLRRVRVTHEDSAVNSIGAENEIILFQFTRGNSSLWGCRTVSLGNYTPIDTASRSRRLESSVTPL
jgi:hypothetical protein